MFRYDATLTSSQLLSQSESPDALLPRFANLYGGKITLDECRDPVIKGKLGEVYLYDETKLAFMFIPKETRQFLWPNRRKKLLAIGCILLQDGDTEGAVSFDVNNAEQCRLVLSLGRIARRRTLSEKERERRRLHIKAVNESSPNRQKRSLSH